MVLLGVVMVLLGGCYSVSEVMLCCCYDVLGVAIVLLGGCYGVARWLLWCC